jgi:hypothetical protein
MGTNEEVRRYYVPGARVTGQKSARPDSPVTTGGQSGLKKVSVWKVSISRTVRSTTGGQSATGGQSGLPMADSPV